MGNKSYLCSQNDHHMAKILITGASGFIGSFIVEEALRQGMETWAAVRKSSSRLYLQDQRIHFIELNLSSEEDLKKQLTGHSFDYIVHAAGVTKCLHQEDFFRINTEGTKHLVRALIALQMPIKRFVDISSLSVYGPVREQQPYEEIREKFLKELNAGVTMSYIQTGLLGEDGKGIICIIPSRKLYNANEIVRSIDPEAFITVTKIKEVKGRGFTSERQQLDYDVGK